MNDAAVVRSDEVGREGDGRSGDGRSGDDLRAVVEAQAKLIESLQERIDRLEGPEPTWPAQRTATPPHRSGPGESSSTPPADGSTSRRNMLTRGAAVAAGAVVGGTVLGVAQASPAAAAPGIFDGNPAVDAIASPSSGVAIHGIASTGTGVQGVAPSGTGVTGDGAGVGVAGTASAVAGVGVAGLSSGTEGRGVTGHADSLTGFTVGVLGEAESTFGIGVRGVARAETGDSAGVVGISNAAFGPGVRAQGTFGLMTSASRTQVVFGGGALPPLEAGIARVVGEMTFDHNQDLWLCVVEGTPGTWRRIAGPQTAGAFVLLPAPVRVYDSRVGFPPATGPKTPLEVDVARDIDCRANASGVPTEATGVMVNLIAVNPSAEGFLSIYAAGILFPGTSNVNFAAGQTIAVNTVSALGSVPGSEGKVALRANVVTDVVLDIIGYYQ